MTGRRQLVDLSRRSGAGRRDPARVAGRAAAGRGGEDGNDDRVHVRARNPKARPRGHRDRRRANDQRSLRQLFQAEMQRGTSASSSSPPAAGRAPDRKRAQAVPMGRGEADAAAQHPDIPGAPRRRNGRVRASARVRRRSAAVDFSERLPTGCCCRSAGGTAASRSPTDSRTFRLSARSSSFTTPRGRS